MAWPPLQASLDEPLQAKHMAAGLPAAGVERVPPVFCTPPSQIVAETVSQMSPFSSCILRKYTNCS